MPTHPGKNKGNSNGAQGGLFSAKTEEFWAGVVVLVALALLIAIRSGFRGVNVFGVRAGVS